MDENFNRASFEALKAKQKEDEQSFIDSAHEIANSDNEEYDKAKKKLEEISGDGNSEKKDESMSIRNKILKVFEQLEIDRTNKVQNPGEKVVKEIERLLSGGIPEELRDDKESILLIMRSNREMFKKSNLSERLINDKDVILKALDADKTGFPGLNLKECRDILKELSPNMLNNQDVLSVLKKRTSINDQWNSVLREVYQDKNSWNNQF